MNKQPLVVAKKGWKAPEDGMVKLNKDGALFPHRQIAGIGSVLCDDLGRVLMEATKPKIMVGDRLRNELLAILRGLQLCIPLGLRTLEVESDSLLALNALKEGDELLVSYSHLLREILKLRQRFPHCSFSYMISRVENFVAHKLARSTCLVEDLFVWWENVPDFILSELWADQCPFI